MTAVAPNVLIAENDDLSRVFLVDNLEADGYRPVCAAVTSAALGLLSATLDALIVDVNGDTLGMIDAIRGQVRLGIDPDLPILVLTSHTGELHRTRLLERGADDVLCKPYSYPELRARLGALLRRAEARRAPRVLRAGSLRLDVRSRRAWVGEVELEPLRGKEYQLLLALIAEPERVLTKVNFETRPEEGRERGIQGLGAGLVIPFPLGGSGRLTTEHRGFVGSAKPRFRT
jgi:two-component system phosphate regulon response regulator PhoB